MLAKEMRPKMRQGRGARNELSRNRAAEGIINKREGRPKGSWDRVTRKELQRKTAVEESSIVVCRRNHQ